MRAVWVLLAMALLALPIGAQPESAPTETPEVFGETVDVNVVNVDVYVTDSSGRRVLDLGRDDFEIFEDGKPMAISNFHVVTNRHQSQREIRPAEIDSKLVSIDPILYEQRQLHLIVYVDNSNIQPFNRNRLFAYLHTFLHNNLADGDRVAVYTFEKQLHLRQPFTENFEQVANTMREIEEMSALGLTKESDRRDLIKDIDRANGIFEIQNRVRMHSENLFNDLQFTIGGLREGVDALSGLPGRRAILYVSDGLPMRVDEDLWNYLGDRFEDPSLVSEAVSYDASRKFGELTAHSNANEVTLYTIQASGLRSHGMGNADTRAVQGHSATDAIRRINLQSPMLEMAGKTGGVAIIGTSNFSKGLEEIGEDFSGYYSLGYSPSHSGDGRYHDIKVKVKRKDLDLRHREGYRAKSPSQRMMSRTTAALAYDFNANPLDLEVEVEGAHPSDGRDLLVPIVVRVGLDKIVLLPRGDVYEGRLTLYLAAVDEKGRQATMPDQLWSVRIPAADIERAKGMSYAHEVTLSMRPGAHKIAVGVRDNQGGVTAFRSKAFRIGS